MQADERISVLEKRLEIKEQVLTMIQHKLQDTKRELRRLKLEHAHLVEAIRERDPWIGYVPSEVCGFCKTTYPEHEEDCPWVLAREDTNSATTKLRYATNATRRQETKRMTWKIGRRTTER